MREFLDENFLLTNRTAQVLYHDYAAKMPIIDYHCHINPREIAENRSFDNITQIWLNGDHYKWRLMRANGIEEKYITGNASDYDKFYHWSKTLPKAIGNPLYHWSHMELRRYFDYNGLLNPSTAARVWTLCNEKLESLSMKAQNIIKRSRVELICTTDDPADSLSWHKAIKMDTGFGVKVLPAFRPDKALNIENPDFIDYIKQLSKVSGIPITDFSSLCAALEKRMEFFNALGCRTSDHSLDYIMYEPANADEIEAIFAKRIKGILPDKLEQLKYKTAFLLFAGKQYHKYGWIMQLHYGAKRNNNTSMYTKAGADTGFDCIHTYSSSAQMADFLNALNQTDELPKTIIYSLNPNENEIINTVIGCFQDSSAAGKLQHGAAWWFNDHKMGITAQMIALANTGLLSNFIGMLTDSRSFLSYTRHEYFRRILCNLIGIWVENGEYPNDLEYLGQIVQDISYYNVKRYFGF
ncbi:MAG: Uronate isomerase [Lachnoclostridium sp.]|jgi:glucuronate isomerase